MDEPVAKACNRLLAAAFYHFGQSGEDYRLPTKDIRGQSVRGSERREKTKVPQTLGTRVQPNGDSQRMRG